MIASDPSMAALFGMDADGGSLAKSLSDTPSLVESQTVSEVELEQMFGDDTAAIADWKQFTDAGVSLPPFGNDNTQALEGRDLLHEGFFPFLPCSENQWCSLDPPSHAPSHAPSTHCTHYHRTHRHRAKCHHTPCCTHSAYCTHRHHTHTDCHHTHRHHTHCHTSR